MVGALLLFFWLMHLFSMDRAVSYDAFAFRRANDVVAPHCRERRQHQTQFLLFLMLSRFFEVDDLSLTFGGTV
jgi:hypothetical protein